MFEKETVDNKMSKMSEQKVFSVYLCLSHILNICYDIAAYSGREWTFGFKLHWYPNLYTHVFLFVASKNLDISCYQCLNFSTNNLNQRMGKFVYHHRGCILIYRPLSYPYRSLLHIKFMGKRKEETLGVSVKLQAYANFPVKCGSITMTLTYSLFD